MIFKEKKNYIGVLLKPFVPVYFCAIVGLIYTCIKIILKQPLTPVEFIHEEVSIIVWGLLFSIFPVIEIWDDMEEAIINLKENNKIKRVK